MKGRQADVIDEEEQEDSSFIDVVFHDDVNTDIATYARQTAIDNVIEGPFSRIQHHKKRAFLLAYTICGRVNKAADAADIDRNTHYNWLDTDPEYAELFNGPAQKMRGDSVEDEVARRAMDGVMRPVYQQGKLAGYTREYSDSLAAMLLNGAKPDKYKQRREISGTLGIKAYQDVDLDKV